MIIVHFGRFFYAKKTARRERRYRGFIAFQASCFLFSAGFYCSPFPPFSFASIKNTKIVKPPLSAPTGAADDMLVPSRNAISIPSSAPIVAEAATTAANAATMMIRGPIFTTFTSFQKKYFTRDQGLLSPFDKSRKLGSIIQLIVRNVKRIFIRSYILQIAVLIAASGAFGDQIK